MLEKGAKLPKKEKVVLEPSVLDMNDTINKAKIVLNWCNYMTMVYITDI